MSPDDRLVPALLLLILAGAIGWGCAAMLWR